MVRDYSFKFGTCNFDCNCFEMRYVLLHRINSDVGSENCQKKCAWYKAAEILKRLIKWKRPAQDSNKDEEQR